MNEIVNAQTLLFLTSIQIGIVLGIFYDLIRIFRKLIKHCNWIIQLEDLVYWISCALVGFSILYIHNYSDIRSFIFIGMILGGILYLYTVSILFMKIATCLIDLIKYILKRIIHILSIPLQWIVELLKIPFKIVISLFRRWYGYEKYQIRKLKRKWYYKKSDLRTSIKIKRSK